MLLGMSIETFTAFHVLISLIALAVGAPFLFSLISSKTTTRWTPVFLIFTVATSVTGFMFPLSAFNAPHLFGLISLVVLTLAIFALYGFQAEGPWRWVYVIGTVTAFYLNAFVAVVQAFQKVAFLFNLAPTGSEPPFLIAQLVLLAAFGWFGVLAVKNFRPVVEAAA